MGLIKIGRVIRPHGVKGGMKVSSDFKYKKKAFIANSTIYINNTPYKLLSYSFAGGGQLDIAYLEGINTIDDVIRIRQSDIYINKSVLNIDEILDQELINMDVYLEDELLSTVEDVQSGINPLIIFKYNNKNVYVPRQDVFIKEINVDENKIVFNENIRGLL